MDTNYKSELEYTKVDFAQRILDREAKPSENNKEKADKISSDTISENFEKIENRKCKKDVIQALSIIRSYSSNNFFENLTYDNIKNIFCYATEKNEEEEQMDMEDLKQISKLARDILIQILNQPEPANLFIEKGFLYELRFYFNDTWAILSLATICKISKKNRDIIYEFGFINDFIDCISEKFMPIIDFGASCELAKAFIKYEMTYPEQNQSVRKIFPILYELVDTVPSDEKSVKFLDAASNLIPHIEYSGKYGEENLIHNIFPLLPNGQSINNDKPILPIIEKKIFVSRFNDQNDKWFETSAKYIHDWLSYTFFQSQAREDIESYDFSPLWNILLKILETNCFLKASKNAAYSLVLLIKIDIDNFMSNQYYSAIVEEFPNYCLTIKKELLAVIAIAFYRATNEQMNQLLSQSNILDLIFETLSSIEFDKDHLSDIILGLHRFIDFCGYSHQGMVAFNNLVITNENFENLVEQLIEYTSGLNEDDENQNLIKKAQDLYNIIHQRIDEYDISTKEIQSTEE